VNVGIVGGVSACATVAEGTASTAIETAARAMTAFVRRRRAVSRDLIMSPWSV
jgi:hypothetical protein